MQGVKLTEGTSLYLEALDEEAQILFLSSEKLEEPISWGGPIVMNTKEEIKLGIQGIKKWRFLETRR